MALTDKQQQFYEHLLEFFRRCLRMPTQREAADLNDLKSANSSYQYYEALINEGVLKRDQAGRYVFSMPSEVWPGAQTTGAVIPVLGEITAGNMQEAVEADLGELTFDYLFPDAENVFALRVKGMSMKDLDIIDGDLVLLSKTDLKSGEVGAVLYDGDTTLKRVQKEKAGIRLIPANPDFDDIVIQPGEAEEVRILGKYVGHLNKQGLFKSPY